MTVFRMLVRRHLARFAADRILVIVVAAGLVALLVTSVNVALKLAEHQGGSLTLAASFRQRAWNSMDLFNVLLWTLAFYLGATHVGSELGKQSLFSWLARPISRHRWVLSSWVARAALLVAAELVRLVPALATSWWIEGRLDPSLVAGAALLVMGDLLRMTTVFAIASVAAPAYAVALGLALAVLGLAAWGRDAVGILEVFSSVVPLWGRHERLLSLTLSGDVSNPSDLAFVFAYRSGWIALLLALAVYGFAKRDLTAHV